MPFIIKPFLQKAFPNIRFIPFDPTEDFPSDPRPIFIDTAINLASPRLFTDASEFEPFSSCKLSVHDFDFYTELALREKLGEKHEYFIIGVPPEGDPEQTAKQVVAILSERL